MLASKKFIYPRILRKVSLACGLMARESRGFDCVKCSISHYIRLAWDDDGRKVEYNMEKSWDILNYDRMMK